MSSIFYRHEHAALPEGEHVTVDPIDGILWAHIFIMFVSFAVLFPVGMVAGLARHRSHVPIQLTAGVLAIVGYFLGHSHKGRKFEAGNIHAQFSKILMPIVLGQVAAGIILKLHIEKGFLGKIRQVLLKIHGIVGILIPVLTWVQIGFGAITIPGWCHADHLGQCLAHGIMGSSFVLYGFILTIMLFVGEGVLNRAGRSQEYYDNLVITLWGIINTFTEHRWGQPWSHGDYQHTSMGIIWWCAGMLGLLLSYDWVNKRPRRNHVPALVMIFTGYAMSQHSQNLMVSTKIHLFFGYSLMAAGLVRIIEISFILSDNAHTGLTIKSFQYLTPFLLIESGCMFMGAQEEQMQFLNDAGIMHGSYILVISSVAFLLFLWILSLVNLYMYLSGSTKSNSSILNAGRTPMGYRQTAGGAPAQTGGIEMQPFLTEEEEHELELNREEEELDELARP